MNNKIVAFNAYACPEIYIDGKKYNSSDSIVPLKYPAFYGVKDEFDKYVLFQSMICNVKPKDKNILLGFLEALAVENGFVHDYKVDVQSFVNTPFAVDDKKAFEEGSDAKIVSLLEMAMEASNLTAVLALLKTGALVDNSIVKLITEKNEQPRLFHEQTKKTNEDQLKLLSILLSKGKNIANNEVASYLNNYIVANLQSSEKNGINEFVPKLMVLMAESGLQFSDQVIDLFNKIVGEITVNENSQTYKRLPLETDCLESGKIEQTKKMLNNLSAMLEGKAKQKQVAELIKRCNRVITNPDSKHPTDASKNRGTSGIIVTMKAIRAYLEISPESKRFNNVPDVQTADSIINALQIISDKAIDESVEVAKLGNYASNQVNSAKAESGFGDVRRAGLDYPVRNPDCLVELGRFIRAKGL